MANMLRCINLRNIFLMENSNRRFAMNIRSKRSLLFLCSLFALSSVGLNSMEAEVSVVQEGLQQAQEIAQSDLPRSFVGRLTGALGSGVANLGKAVCWGIGLAGKGSFHAARFMARPDMLKVEAGLAGIGAIYGASKAVVNRVRLYEKLDQCGISKVPTGWSWLLWALSKKNSEAVTPKTGKIKIYNWRLKELSFGERKSAFPTAGKIRKYQGPQKIDQRTGRVLSQDAVDEWYHKHILSELYRDSGLIDIQSKAPASDPRKRMLDTIAAGLAELRAKLNELAGTACFPSRKHDRFGIEKIINDCCKEYVYRMPDRPDNEADIERAASDMRAVFEMNELSFEEEQALDNLIKYAIETKLVHWLTLRPNFGLAATMYWDVLKRIKRLEALQGIADKYHGLQIR